MAIVTHNIIKVNANNFANLDNITQEDANLLTPVEIANTFAANDNFIELNYITSTGEPISTIENYTNFSVLTGDTLNDRNGTKEVAINVLADYKQYNSETSEVIALYNFLDYSYSKTNTPESFYIESISPDRTEVRLVSVELEASQVQEFTNTLIDRKNNSPYAQELFLYKGNNTFYSIINIDIEPFRNTYGVLIKLLAPLPQDIGLKSRLNVVEKVSEPVAYRVFVEITQEEEKIPFLRGANFGIEITDQSTEPSQYFNYNELFSFPTNNSNRELNTLFNKKGAELSIDYADYQNFINFSSAEERLLNFKYKLDLIESYQTNLDLINTSSGTGVTGSATYYRELLNGVVDNLDHYESHLYYESGSTSWPKSNNEIPYINKASNTTEAETWFSTQKTTAIQYDSQNPDILTNSIPTFLKEDQVNEPYNLFIDLIGQHFDNIWVYTDAVSKKYNADNRLNKGVSKDLVEDLLKNFGVKLYTSNRSASDLYRYFTLNSYDEGDEILPQGIISGSNSTPVSEQNYQREVYKRIYHNLPLLMKSKGTERGVRALITCFGIPSDILQVKLFGGQSSTDLPFYGGEQAFTSSLDKIRTDNNNVIVEGDTLSNYTSIYKSNNDVTQDLHRIEIGFSPADNIDNYIVSQSAVLFPTDEFNIDNYIGDPRNTETNNYESLNQYRDVVLENLDRYEVEDFIRLIKFFDNNIFRMVRDFIPARVVADTGVIVKSHLLERNKVTPPVLSWTQPEHTGSLQTGFITGSNAKSYTSTGPNLIRNESRTAFSETIQTPEGIRTSDRKAREQVKFNGEIKGSTVLVTDGELNRDNPLKSIEYPIVKYDTRFFKTIETAFCGITQGTTFTDFVFNIGTTVYANQLSYYNLGGLFGNPASGPYEYTVDSVVQNNAIFNLTPINPVTGRYFPDKQFTVGIDSTSVSNCTFTRNAKTVFCHLTENTNNTPSELTASDTAVDITQWWGNSISSFPNHDPVNIVYKATDSGGTEHTYNSTAAASVDFSTFPDGIINFKIFDNQVPSEGCFTEFNILFTSCTLGYYEQGRLGDTADNPDAPNNTVYLGPFSFTGTGTNTTYKARLVLDSDGTSTPDVFSAYCPIVNTDTFEGVTRFYIPTGNLSNIVNQFGDSGGIEDLDDIIEGSTYGTFTALIASQDQSEALIRLQIVASNGTLCTAESRDDINLVLQEEGQTVHSKQVFRWTGESGAQGQGCCINTDIIPVYFTAYYPNLSWDLEDPPVIWKDQNVDTPADAGWYKLASENPILNQGITRYWNGDSAWGATVVCTGIDVNVCA